MVGQLPPMRPRQKIQDLSGERRQSAPRGQLNPGQKIKSAEKKARKKIRREVKNVLHRNTTLSVSPLVAAPTDLPTQSPTHT